MEEEGTAIISLEIQAYTTTDQDHQSTAAG
jgi:hypothetical protein